MKERNTPLLAWYIWLFGALFYSFEFLLQVSPGVMTDDLMHAFNIDGAALGNLTAFYFYSYAIMQIPAGIFLDYLGPRKLLTLSCTICALGALIFGVSGVLYQAEIGRLLIGLGSAFAVLGTFKLAANWFPSQRFALVTGITIMLGMLGAVFAGTPLALLVQKFSWRIVMQGLACAGFILALLIWLNVRDKPKHKKIPASISASQDSLIIGLKKTLTKPQNWICAVYGGLMFAPTSAFAALWGVPFLMMKYDVARTLAAGAISMVFIGWAIGAPIFGYISDSMRKRKPTLYIGSIGGLLSMLIIIYVHTPFLVIYILLFAFGFFCSGFLPAFSIIREINPNKNSATALGFMNTLNMVGGAVLQPLIGQLLDMQWNGVKLNSVRLYSIHAYHHALLTLPIILLLSLLIIPFIKETHGKSLDEQLASSVAVGH